MNRKLKARKFAVNGFSQTLRADFNDEAAGGSRLLEATRLRDPAVSAVSR